MCTKMMAQNKLIGNRDYNYADDSIFDDAQRKLSNNINTHLSTDLFLFLITELCIQNRQDNEANQTHNGKR